jgi:hypothetical protein
MFDMINIFEVFLPQLLRYPNPTDPLNGEAAALLMREPRSYDARVKGTSRSSVRFHQIALDSPQPQSISRNMPPTSMTSEMRMSTRLMASSARWKTSTATAKTSLPGRWKMSDLEFHSPGVQRSFGVQEAPKDIMMMSDKTKDGFAFASGYCLSRLRL